MPVSIDRSALINKVFAWGIVVFSAVFVADLTSSALENYIRGQITVESKENEGSEHLVYNLKSERSNAGRVELGALLRRPDNEPGDTEDGNTIVSNDNSDSQNDSSLEITKLEGVSLMGIVASGNYRNALLDIDGQTQIIPEGGVIGDYILSEVANSWVYLVPINGKGRGIRLTLETVADGEELEKERDDKKHLLVREVVADDGSGIGNDSERLSVEDIRSNLNDTTRIARQVRVIPISKDGEPYGTRLIFRRPDNLLAKLGLKNNDVLLSVNGNPARSVEDMYQGYMTIRNAENLEFVVDRDGIEKTIRYSLAK